MKNQILSVVGQCMLIGLAAVPLRAQPGAFKAKIPFEFIVGRKTLPAGEYRMIVTPHRVKIQEAEGKIIAIVLANEISGRSAGENGRIIFHCNGEQCLLSEVWSPDYEHGQAVFSRFERDSLKKESRKLVAVLGEKSQK